MGPLAGAPVFATAYDISMINILKKHLREKKGEKMFIEMSHIINEHENIKILQYLYISEKM